MTRIKVAVLRGGPSKAFPESLQTGGYLLSLLRERPEEYEPIDVFISRTGDWHHGGLVGEPAKILKRADIAWNALHGEYGESGGVQQVLEALDIPYIGSSVAASAFAHHKNLAKELYRKQDIPIPSFVVVNEADFDEAKLLKIFRSQVPPFMVKPATGIRGLGVRLARTMGDLKDAIFHAFEHSPKVIVEEYVRGTVVSAPVIEGGRGEALHALLPTHLETHFRRVRPTPAQNREVEEYAKRAHEALGLRHYSSSDFVVTPRGKIYILETNSQPLLHEGSLFHQSLEASGWQAHDFADHMIGLGLR